MKRYIPIRLLLFAVLLAGMFPVSAQTAGSDVVRGVVTDKVTGETLVSVTIAEIDANNRTVNGTATNADGAFAIRFKSPDNKLKFTYLGYQVQILPIGSTRTFNVSMGEDTHAIREVVVSARATSNTGGLSIPTREISTAMQKIDSKEFEGLQVASVDDALQGRIAGLDIVANSGEPGAGMSMRIRGTSSITGNTQPLIVVNGIPFETDIATNFDFSTANEEQYASLISVNPDDIQEITVLKDAAATAVYGSKGANGVLLITTKRGTIGKTKLQYSYRITGAKQPEGMNLLTGDDYTMLMKQAYYNPTLSPTVGDVDEFNYDKNFSEYENFNNNTDWVAAVSQQGWTNDHYVTVSGGGEKARFRVSGGLYNQTGTVIGQTLDRVSTRSFLEYNVSDRMRFTSEFSYTYQNNNKNYADDNNSASLLDIAYRKMPNVSIYAQDMNGNNTDVFYNISQNSQLNTSQKNLMNPVALAMLATNNIKNYRILPTFRLQYDLTDPNLQLLRYDVYVTFDMNNNKVSKFLPKEVSSYSWDNQNVNHAEGEDSESLSIQTENKLTWQPKFTNQDHSFIAMVSLQTKSSSSQGQEVISYGQTSSNISDPSTAAYLYSTTSSLSAARSMGVLEMIHYAYKSRYIFDLTVRTDGSTRFGPNHRFGTFPGVSGKWIISDEDFWKPLKGIINDFAIRPSWGISGNQPSREYLHYSLYGAYSTGYMDMTAIHPVALQLSNLRWETSASTNIGMDINMFDNKLTWDLNYYHKRTKDLLFPSLDIPSSSGYATLTYQNVGTMDNDGWEINMHASNLVKTKNLSLSFNMNLSNQVNTIISLTDKALNSLNADFSGSNGSYLTRVQENNAYGSIYGFRYLGVYQYNEYDGANGHTNAAVAKDKDGNVITDAYGLPKPIVYAPNGTTRWTFKGGDAKYEDINHDGSIDELDIVYLGNSNPKLNGGFGPTMRYKDFGLTLFFNFRYGNSIVNAARMNAENMYTNDNQSISVNWRWRKDGDNTSMPRALYNTGYNWLGSDRYVEDGSFLRFKYLTFNYNVPVKLLKPIGLSQISTYLTFNNVYCFTNYTGVDPEIGYSGFSVAKDQNKTPRSKDFTLGVTIGF